jgi:RimJ/RimL family protein N-acetyltransferase
MPPINLQPTLHGQYVHVRPLHEDDWTSLFAVASDPLIWAQHPAKDRYREEVFREFFAVAMASQAAFLILDAHDGRVIGSSRYHGYNAEAREIEIGWTFLARSHWGGRYNGELKQLMLDHAFQFVDRVIFVIGAENIRSRTAVERLGGVLLPSHSSGSPGRVVYAIDRIG